MPIYRKLLTAALVTGMAAAPALADDASGPANLGMTAGNSTQADIATRGLGGGGMMPDWSGIYGGASLGAGRASWSRSSSTSAIGNLFAVYLADMGDYVVGADATFAPAAVFGSFSTANEELRAAWAIYGRFGVKVDAEGRTLASVGVGPSWVRTRDDAGDTRTSAGVSAGLGLDYLLDESWLLRSGVTYSRFGSVGARGDRVNSVSAHVGAAFRF